MVQPASVVDPLLRPGPAAELFPIVSQHSQPVSRAPELSQIRGRLFRRAEGNQIAKALIDREQCYPFAVAFGPERRVQLLVAESGSEEMPVVHERIAHAGSRK